MYGHYGTYCAFTLAVPSNLGRLTHLARRHVPSQVRDMAKTLVDQWVWPLLLKHNFKRSGKEDFVRWQGDWRCKVLTSFEKERKIEAGCLSFRFWIAFQSLWEFFRDCGAFQPFLEVYRNDPILVSESLTNIMFPKQGLVFISDESDITEVGQQICQNIETYGIAWMNGLDTLEKNAQRYERIVGQNRSLDDKHIWIWAAIEWILGRKQHARELLLERIENRKLHSPEGPSNYYDVSVRNTKEVLDWLELKELTSV